MKDLVQIVPDYVEKVGTMNTTILAARDAESAGYAHYMAKALAATDAQRAERKALAEIRFKRHGIDPNAQQPSTQAILARPKEKDLEHFLRPLVDCQVRDKDGNIDVAERKVTAEEVSHVESVRRRSKNTTGESDKSAFEDSKEKAVDAFLCSPGVILTPEELQRVTKMVAYEDQALAIKQIEQPKPVKWDLRHQFGLFFWDMFRRKK